MQGRVDPGLLAAALIGAGGGLRSFSVPAVLAARGRGPLAGGARFIAYGAAAGELVADKQPDMSSRWAPRGLTLRLGFAAVGGQDRAGPAGAAVAMAAAALTARVGTHLRERVSSQALAAAAAEDVLSYVLVARGAATR